MFSLVPVIVPLAERDLTDDELGFRGEIIFRHLEVERGRTLSDSAGDIIVRAVAWAEPPTVITGLANGYASKMRANT